MNAISVLHRALPGVPGVARAPLTFFRNTSSARRTTKLLRLHPHQSFKLGPDSPSSTHIVHNSPSSAPSVYATPSLFLPSEDPRKKILPQVATKDSSSELPPPLKKPYEKKYHLTPSDFERMRSLRNSDPKHWTKLKLAKEFNCSPLFVGMVVQANDQRLREVEKEKEKVTKKWGEKRKFARAERKKRRETWGKDEY